MNLSLFQRYFIKCLISDNKNFDYIKTKDTFENKFKDINFIINDDYFRKIKNTIVGVVNNKIIGEICNFIKKI